MYDVQFMVAHAEATLTVIGMDPESKYTSSPATGNDTPLAPPAVADQLVVEFQFPVPPDTKCLAAIRLVC